VGLINLTYIASKDFVDQVIALLENEGVSAARGTGQAVSFVSLDQLGAVAVFASGPEVLDRVEFWARQIDRPNQGPSLQYFIYQPKHARASDLLQSLAPLLGAAVSQSGNLSRDTKSAFGSTSVPVGSLDASAPPISQANALRRDSGSSIAKSEGLLSIDGDGVRVSAESRANSLIFHTSGLKYEALLPMIRRLDVPPKQVVIEATVAEVTLTGDFAYGVEVALSGRKWDGNTELGLPGGGLALNYVSVGTLAERLRLRLAATDSQVRILSRPTLVVRDGLEAEIVVGNDIPTVGATASSPLESARQVTAVLYRKTGLKLGIRPTINAEGTVVLEIQQEISNAVPGSSGVQGAPIFFERSIKTEVVANSGQSVLLAGLISESSAATTSNVPGLSRVPLLGALLRSDEKKRERTELVLLITVRVLESTDQWDSNIRRVSDALEMINLGTSR
jgi:general secretion pathway protein D